MNIINLQDSFLNNVRRERITITVYLNNGFKLTGTVLGFDNYVIFIETDRGQQLIYKHAITSILFLLIPIGMSPLSVTPLL